MQVVVVGQFGCDLNAKMHFSVPDTVELKDKNGSNYLVSIPVICFATISQFVVLCPRLALGDMSDFVHSLNAQSFVQ